MRVPLTIIAGAVVALGCARTGNDASASPPASASASGAPSGRRRRAGGCAPRPRRGAAHVRGRGGARARDAIATERALPAVDTTSWITLRNAAYDVSARVPPGWNAELGHDKIVDVDTWTLWGPTHREGPHVTLWLAKPPRRGRHSAGFPGGLDGSEVDARRSVAGAERPVTLLSGGAQVRGDFDTPRVVVTFRAHADAAVDRAAVRAILEHLRVAP